MKLPSKQQLIRNQIRCSILLAFLMVPMICNVTQAQSQKDGNVSKTGLSDSQPTYVININSATLQELTLLPGIGPSRAHAIITLRKKMGQFKRIENLLRVRGIGRKTLRRLFPMLTLHGPNRLFIQKTNQD